MTISELVNAKNSKCWRRRCRTTKVPVRIMGKDFSMVRYQQPGLGRLQEMVTLQLDPPEITLNNRREAIQNIEEIESTVTSLHREAEAQFRPELEKIVSGIETGFRGTARVVDRKHCRSHQCPPGG